MNRIFLRALELSDLQQVYIWHNDADLYRSLTSPHRHVNLSSEEEWLRKKITYSMQEINLAICLKEDSKHIGNIYLRNIDWVARNAELAIFIGDVNQRCKGYGEEAVRLCIRYSFYDLGLYRVFLYVLEDNFPAIRMYEKCGLIIEGKLRNHAYKEGQFKNILVMGICAGDS